MSMKNNRKSPGPGWPVIASQSDLEIHDVHSPAYLLIPPALVGPVWVWLDHLHAPGDHGDCARSVEKLLVCIAEKDAEGIASSLNDLKDTVWRAFDVALRFDWRDSGSEWSRRRLDPVPLPDAADDDPPGEQTSGIAPFHVEPPLSAWARAAVPSTAP